MRSPAGAPLTLSLSPLRSARGPEATLRSQTRGRWSFQTGRTYFFGIAQLVVPAAGK
jgi:hypothetical protein